MLVCVTVARSLCTLEFQTRHESYMWLLNELDLYKPHVWEFSRLNITHFVMSKRKLNQLCTSGDCGCSARPRRASPHARAFRYRQRLG